MSCSLEVLRLAGAALDQIWTPLMQQGLLRRIPSAFSTRLVRRLADESITIARAHATLADSLRFRRSLGQALSDSEETLESLWEQHLRTSRAVVGSPSTMHLGAAGQLETIRELAGQQALRPQRMDLIPDGRTHIPHARSSPEGLAHYAQTPEHLRGMGMSERFEIATLTQPGALPSRIAEAIAGKVQGNQLVTPLMVGGVRAPTWGTVIINVPTSFSPLTRQVVDAVHDALSTSNVYSAHGGMHRYLVHQGNTWFGAIRTAADTFEVRSF